MPNEALLFLAPLTMVVMGAIVYYMTATITPPSKRGDEGHQSS